MIFGILYCNILLTVFTCEYKCIIVSQITALELTGLCGICITLFSMKFQVVATLNILHTVSCAKLEHLHNKFPSLLLCIGLHVLQSGIFPFLFLIRTISIVC